MEIERGYDNIEIRDEVKIVRTNGIVH